MRLQGREYFWGFFSFFSLPRQDFYLTKADSLNNYSFVLLFCLVYLFFKSTLNFEAAILAIQIDDVTYVTHRLSTRRKTTTVALSIGLIPQSEM